MSCEVSDGVVNVTLQGDFSQEKLSQAIRLVAGIAGSVDEARVLIRRVDGPHSALRAYEHVYSLQSEVVPAKTRVAFLAGSPEDLKAMQLLVGLIRQKHLFSVEAFTSEEKALVWLKETETP